MADFDCDTLVVGSGSGGLAAAVALAQAGQKVQVLEQHYLPGGYMHSFQLGGFRFSPGVHYLGQLQEGGEFRNTLEGLGLAEHLTMLRLNPDGYDHIRADGHAFDFCSGVDALTERFAARFPQEQAGIREYLGLIEKIRIELLAVGETHGFWETLTLPFRTKHMGRFGLYSLQRILTDRVKDPIARAMLSVQCGDHGLPPSKVPFAMHAAVTGHYLDGGCYPKGGGSALVKAYQKELAKAGGELHLETRVEKLLLEGKRVIGAKLKGGRELRARHVISNADPFVTFGRLIGHDHLPGGLKKKLAATSMSISSIGLYLGVDMDVKAAGMDSGNYWLARSLDAESTYTAIAQPEIVESRECPGLFLTCTTLKDASVYDGKRHTLEAFTFVPYSPFEKFASSSPDARPPEYEALKNRLADQMISLIETLLPGLRKHIVFQAVSTPLTNDFYVETSRGAIYGTEKIRTQMGPWSYPSKTPFAGLSLVGSSVLGHGVHGAALSGVAAAARLLDCRPSEVLAKKRGSLKILPADDTSQWPDELRRTMQVRQQTRATGQPSASA